MIATLPSVLRLAYRGVRHRDMRSNYATATLAMPTQTKVRSGKERFGAIIVSPRASETSLRRRGQTHSMPPLFLGKRYPRTCNELLASEHGEFRDDNEPNGY